VGPKAFTPAEEFWMVKVKPSATALVSWNVKFVVKLAMFIGVVKKTLPASVSPPFVNSSWLLERTAEPLNCKPLEVVKPEAKLMFGALELIVNIAVTAGLSLRPGEDAMAVIVVVEVTEMAVVYFVELCVGVVPLVV
jgi:hypothetical protein